MQVRLIAVLFFVCTIKGYAQDPKKVRLLQDHIDKATNDSSRVVALGELADYFYIFKAEQKADSILQEQLTIAEISQNNNLIFATLFSNSVNNIGTWTTTQTFDRTLQFVEKGLDYAKAVGRSEYLALGYIRKAALLRKRGEFDNALREATLAFASLGSTEADSIKAALHIELGNIYLARSEAPEAYKNYNNAYYIAYQLKNEELLCETYHQFAWLYHTLHDINLAKSNLFKSLEMNTASNNRRQMLYDYIDLARITDNKEFIDKAIRLANVLQVDRELMFSKKLLYAYYMVVKKDVALTLGYFKSNPDLQQYYMNQGPANYNWNIGNIYKYGGQPDSALHYYLKAAPGMQKEFSIGTRLFLHRDIADCYAMLKQPAKAIASYRQALELGAQMKNFSFMSGVSNNLSQLYAASGDYRLALQYSERYSGLKDTLQQLSAKSDVALLAVERESKRAQKDMDERAAGQLRVKNLQYWAIGIAIAFVFITILLLGMFPVSKVFINLIGFCAFICLFEFIVLLIDTEFLHYVTHGEPLKLWLIKIVLIALLVPLQHFLEHALTKFVNSRKLMRLRQTMSEKKWWFAAPKRKPEQVNDFEEDTAVL
jgi:tetratricopeptide (TPR) repeat protein